jgi:hypothetical protein
MRQRRNHIAGFLCAFVAWSPAVRAEAPAAARAPARTVEQILADHAAALGGEAPWKGKRSLKRLQDVSVVAQGISGSSEEVLTSKGQSLALLTIPGVGLLRIGNDGKRCWSHDPINGLRVLVGVEAEQARLQNTWKADLRLGELYKSIKVVPAAGAPGEECLELTPAEGKPSVQCFDATTHLPTTIRGIAASPQGESPFVARVSDWRDVGGMKVPHRQELVSGPATIVFTLKSLTWNVPTPARLFALPKGK